MRAGCAVTGGERGGANVELALTKVDRSIVGPVLGARKCRDGGAEVIMVFKMSIA